MIRYVTDENFRGPITRGIRRRAPEIDIVRVQDTGLTSISDSDLLEWAARNNRVVLTHDEQTLIGFAYDRVSRRLPMAGVLKVPERMAPGPAVEQAIFIALVSDRADFDDQVRHLPLW